VRAQQTVGDGGDHDGEPDRQQVGRAGEIDILRLRAMIMIIIVAGWPGPQDASYKPSHVQVLPGHHPTQAETWPRLIGRVLQPVFGGADPALGHIKFDRGHDRLPDDLLETLACCLWSVNAAAMATQHIPACAKLSPMLTGLAARIATFLGLSREEKAAPAFADVVEGMDKRFGNRLQLPPLTGAVLASAKRPALAI